MPRTQHVHRELRIGLYHQEIAEKFRVGVYTACEKVNKVDTDKNLFKLVPVTGHGARVLPLELVPRHGAQICAWEAGVHVSSALKLRKFLVSFLSSWSLVLVLSVLCGQQTQPTD